MRLTETTLSEQMRSRFVIATGVILFLFGTLLIRVWYLQIFQGRKFKQFSEQNRITIKNIPAMRGRIFDRNGIAIAESRASFDLMLEPGGKREARVEVIGKVADLLNWEESERVSAEKKVRSERGRDPIIVKKDMSRDEVARILVRQYQFPGVEIIHSPARSYPFGSHGSHFLGYLLEVSKRQMQKMRESGNREYKMGDVRGVSGVERAFEKILRGKDGARPFIEDARGREVGEEVSGDLLPDFQRREEEPGLDLVFGHRFETTRRSL